ncbi:MAG TPA: hypothetical protein VHJ20_22990 [Polyangia bacterium]|nr:hypothetical protein [Polyangia bacterium]
MTHAWKLASTASLLVSLTLACSSGSGNGGTGGSTGNSGGSGSTGTGGTTATGGTTGTGGTTATGGTTGMGGVTGTGGSGGTTSTGGTGGIAATGGAGGTTSPTSTGGATGTGGIAGSTGAGGATAMTFFVTSDKSMTGNLGGLAGADKRCQDLAAAAGQGARTWHAYLSVAAGPGGGPVNAKDRIGAGPWHNSKGALLAASVAELHAATKTGNYMLFIDEKGQPIPGHWTGSPAADGVQHDILTGSNADGTLKANDTCKDWTSTANADKAWVGHSDGLGPNGDTTGALSSWNSSHENGGCDDTAPRGGAGRLYCFAIN